MEVEILETVDGRVDLHNQLGVSHVYTQLDPEGVEKIGFTEGIFVEEELR